MTHNDFGQAMYLTRLLYGIEFQDPSEFEEIGMIAWGMIGNKNVRLYRLVTEVDDSLQVLLPCNCDIIESVTQWGEDWNSSSNIYYNGDYSSKWTEEYIERRKKDMHPLYSHGHYIHYNRVGDKLYFDKPYCKVEILYKGIELDDNGLPFLNDKEVLAIATYVAWIVKYKDALRTNNRETMQIAMELLRRWNTLVDEARCPEELTQNDMNEIMDVKSSWDRKVYGKSYFPMIK